MTTVTQLGYVRFGVSDPDEWDEFARTILPLQVCREAKDPRRYLRMDYWHHRIILEEDSSDDLLASGLRVAGREEFREMQQQLTEAGIPFEVATAEQAGAERVLELMTLVDPAGNPIEIFHGPQIDTHRPFHPGRGMHGRLLTGDGGVGHMILRHDGLDTTYEFYKALGMRGGIEYRVPGSEGRHTEILFMHCNSRDHTFAFGDFGAPQSKRINHLMLEFDNLDDVFLTYNLVQASRYPVRVSLGRHANDRMFSFYFEGPSGWMIEIGYDGRPATHQSEYYIHDTYGHDFIPD